MKKYILTSSLIGIISMSMAFAQCGSENGMDKLSLDSSAAGLCAAGSTPADFKDNGVGNAFTRICKVDGPVQGGGDYTIMPNISVDYSTNKINSDDTAIRESSFGTDGKLNLNFGNGNNPLAGGVSISKQNIVPDTNGLSTSNFSNIFQQSTGMHLKFSIVNAIKTATNMYPFLEYKLEFKNGGSDVEIPDRFFHVYGNSKVGKYNVELNFDRPVIESDASSDFTVLF